MSTLSQFISLYNYELLDQGLSLVIIETAFLDSIPRRFDWLFIIMST